MPRFSHPWPEPRRGLREILRWKLGTAEKDDYAFPEAKLPANVLCRSAEDLARLPAAGWLVTWLGHAGFLLSGCGVHLLVDPVFSEYCSPLRLNAFRRLAAAPCGVSDLPSITAILLTHGHYDHCDLPTLQKFAPETPVFAPSGQAAWLRRHGMHCVTECAWWEGGQIAPGIQITATPARHFTARHLFDRNKSHWCGWAIQGSGTTVWHAGDTAMMPAFTEIGLRLGGIDCGLIPIGAYAPRWFMHPFHMDPAEALEAAILARCKKAIGMHWGTFRLTDEPLGEPPRLLAHLQQLAGLPDDFFTTGSIGEQWLIPPNYE